MRTLRLLPLLVLANVSVLSTAQTPDLAYELDGSLAPTVGTGPSLVAGGGTLGATSYSFGSNQGLALPASTLDSTSTYTIDFTFTTVNAFNYNKLIDFKDRTVDTGFYALNNGLTFFNTGLVGGSIPNDTAVRVTLVRDGATNGVRGFTNGALAFSFTDAGGAAIFSGTDALFFYDDSQVSGESRPGSVEYLRFYSGALSDAQVANLGNPVPEPATMAALGLGALALLRRRRAR